jgi:hypothetical protein
VRRARLEAIRARELLSAALADAGHADTAARTTVRPLLVVVGGRLLVAQWPTGVSVVMTRQLLQTLIAIPATLSTADVGTVFEVARRSTSWILRQRPPSP